METDKWRDREIDGWMGFRTGQNGKTEFQVEATL